MEASHPERQMLMEEVVGQENMLAAYKRVCANKGAPGIDGMRVEEVWGYCVLNWSRIREELLEGRYQPQPVLGVEIPKPGGGVRQLGIPTAMDRLIQQALHQVLTPIFDPGFSESSYGFRPGRSAHQAVRMAREYVAAGKRWVVDMDLEKFFDRVNHDVLMARVARKVKDPRVLGLIRRYLQAGLMQGGVASQRVEGTPQGGPLSPLLSNILLDDLDKELERRGHAFCRYADDCNIYVQTKRSGERVKASITRFLTEPVGVLGQRSEERRGPPLEPEISRLHHDDAQKAASEGGAVIGDAAEECRTRGTSQRAWPIAVLRRHYPHAEAAGLGELLQAGGSEERFRGAGYVAAAQAAQHHLATVETVVHAGEEPDAPGAGRRAGLEISHQRARPLVELRRVAHEPRLPEALL
jgi:retron-type reverse transcriptase